MKISRLILSLATLVPVLAFSGAVDYQGERNSFGRFHGQGTYITSLGEKYQGQWVDGKKSGQGTYTWKNGDQYTGQWEDNKRNGMGKMSYGNGNSYEGEWVANKAQGDGTLYFKNKDVYSGLFKDGQPSGQGKMTFANGDKFSGRWQAGQMSGPGVYLFKNGDKLSANWNAGAVEKRSAKYLFQNGVEYQGELKNMKPHGNGTCLENGVSNPCQYREGVVVKMEVKKAVVEKAVPAPVPVVAKKVDVPPPVPVVKEPAKPQVYLSDKDEITLAHNWTDKGQFGQWTALQATVVEDDFEDIRRLEITAKSQEMSLVLKIDNYKGEGKYPLAFYNARVTYQGAGAYATTDEHPGEITVTRDNGKRVSATFSFQAYPNGNASMGKQKAVTHGQVTAQVQP